MGEVFAGFVCGYSVALVGAPLLALAMARLRASSPMIARLFPVGTPAVPFMLVLHGGLMIVFTGAGLILGMVLLAMKDAEAGLGSRNIAFSLLVFALTLAVFAPVVALAGRFRIQAILAAAGLVALFGWLMPYMAQWSKFGSS